MTKAKKVVEFIKQAGSAGRRFSEIQRYVVEVLNGKNYDEKIERIVDWKTNRVGLERRYRGYWCTNLLGTFPSYRGILRDNGCVKISVTVPTKKKGGTMKQTRWVHRDHASPLAVELAVRPLYTAADRGYR